MRRRGRQAGERARERAERVRGLEVEAAAGKVVGGVGDLALAEEHAEHGEDAADGLRGGGSCCGGGVCCCCLCAGVTAGEAWGAWGA